MSILVIYQNEILNPLKFVKIKPNDKNNNDNMDIIYTVF